MTVSRSVTPGKLAGAIVRQSDQRGNAKALGHQLLYRSIIAQALRDTEKYAHASEASRWLFHGGLYDLCETIGVEGEYGERLAARWVRQQQDPGKAWKAPSRWSP